MFKADIGDFLYIIIFAILILLGGLEKIFRGKRQPQPPPPQPHDDFEDVDEHSSQEETPQTIEDMMRRMMETIEGTQEEAISFEKIPETHTRIQYQPISETFDIPFIQNQIIEDKQKTNEVQFDFDLRQAVIASEILNRKY